MIKKFNIKLILFTSWFVIADLLSKIFAKKYLVYWDLQLIFWTKFSLAYNEWIAFSIPIKWMIQIILSFVFLWIFILYAQKHWNLKKPIANLAISLIFGWAIWNLYERILFWKVTDFISIFSWYPTFNLADSFIFIWVILILFFEKHFKKLLS